MEHDSLCPFFGEPNRDPDRLCLTCEHIRAARHDERKKRDAYWQERMEKAWLQLDAAGMESLALRKKLADERERIAQAIEAAQKDENLRRDWELCSDWCVDTVFDGTARIARNGGSND